jgi:Flp pilus assembly protein TadD
VCTFPQSLRIIVPLVAVVLLSGCESNDRVASHNPGALPGRVRDVTPQLNASTYVAHGHLLERQGNFEHAAQQYRRAIELTPDLVTAHNRLGVTLNKLGEHREASSAFRQAILLQPDAVHLFNNLGFSLYLESRYEEAEATLKRALELDPNFTRARMNHGVVLAKLGRFDEALEDFLLSGPEADAYYNVAVLYTDDGQYVAAAAALERALQVDPQFAAARQQLRHISRMAAAEEEQNLALAAAEESVAMPLEADAPAADDAKDVEAQDAAAMEPDPSETAQDVTMAAAIEASVESPPTGAAEFTPALHRVLTDRGNWRAIADHLGALMTLGADAPLGGPLRITGTLGALIDGVLSDGPWYNPAIHRLAAWTHATTD